MSAVECLRNVINERLTAAAAEIFVAFEKAISVYEEELRRQRRLLDVVLKPEIKLFRTELPQQHVCSEEVRVDQQLSNHQRISGLDKEDPEPSKIKEEQEDICTTLNRQEGQQLVLKQEDDLPNPSPTCERSDQSENGTLVLNFNKGPADHISTNRIRSESDSESSGVSEPSGDHQLFIHVTSPANDQDGQSGNHGSATKPGTKHEHTPTLSGNAKSEMPKAQTDQDNDAFDLENTVSTSSQPKLHYKPFKCDSCSKEFDLYTQLRVHTRTHTTEKPFSCTVCGKGFSLKRYLAQHMITHSEERPYTCNICGKTFRRSQHLKVHTGRHTEISQPFVCNEEALSDQTLCSQERNLSLDQEEPLQIKEEQEEFCTSLEGRQLALKQEDNVMNSDTTEKSFSCTVCGKGFEFKRNLAKHMTIHSAEKPFSCSRCRKTFRRLEHLKVHMRSHTGEKPYSCVFCGKEFSYQASLTNHVRVHTGEQPYQCIWCGKRFANSKSLKIHIRTHTGEKPYECNTCGKKYTQNRGLILHRRIHAMEKQPS